jgi:hypothetical protein
VDERQERVSKNEAMYRAVNRELERASREAGGDAGDQIEALCECGEDGCTATLEISVSEYDDAHRERDRFVVVPGHENEEIEHVATRTERYLVVDKFGEAEQVAEAEERREDVE